ncbi:hypothetical protein PC120_g2218 [Phytophthora cactorum]|nr:hypothetical protein PC120_g2218 [Phytophthora cactorum]
MDKINNARRMYTRVPCTNTKLHIQQKCVGGKVIENRAIASFSTQLNRGNCAVDVASFCNGWLLEDSVQRLDKFLHTQFNGVALIERQADFCRYKVTAPRHDASNDSTQAQEQIATALSRMFEIVEAAKGRLDIKEYSLSQTTLEQIFNSFAGRRSAVEPGNLGNNSILQ